MRTTGAKKPQKKAATKRQATTKKQAKSGRKGKPSPANKPDSRFVNDLLVRGEAAERDKSGKLPLSATHVIEKKNPDGSVQVKRVRFKAF